MNLDNILLQRPNKTIYRDGDKLIKLFHEGFSKADVLNEALLSARVEETEINVPKVREVITVGQRWAIVSDFIEGETMQTLLSRGERLDEYMERFVRLHMRVHTQTAPLLMRLKDKLHRKITATDFTATQRYELHTRLDEMPQGTQLLHGDFTPGNVIIGNDGKDYVIDWSHATVGCDCADAAGTFLRYVLAGQREEGEKYLALYSDISDNPRQLVLQWLPLVAAARLTRPVTAEERDILLKLIEFENNY